MQAWLQPAVGHGQVLVDPNVWGIGRLPVSSFVLSAATDRLKVLGMARLQERFVPCEGVRPGLFRWLASLVLAWLLWRRAR